jgi:DNA repair protein RecN (Recombination protein N)
MTDSRIEFRLTKLDELDLNGGMSIECLFSANKAMEMKSIEKAVSGGELSRVMLAIQKELSDKKGLPTLILDEIDTGVSGEVAYKVGQFLSKIGEKLQCIAVTHLPQVAAKAKSHLEVSKSDSKTKIYSLSSEERLVAVAKMMSGENVTEAALENAKALILPN